MNSTGSTHDPRPRRNFLWEAGAVVVGGLAMLGAAAGSVLAALDPLLRRPAPPASRGTSSAGPGEGFIQVASLDALPADGLPRRFAVIADRLDAWNFIPDQPIGAVYLRRPDEATVEVFQTICPHLGCSVSPTDTGAGIEYHCPCHNSSFDISGQRINRPGKKNPSPRDMDALEYEVVDNVVWVKFQTFHTGREEKEVKT